ncbi:MAG TPA: GspMb/PilO family protein [Thermoanaerobaculia bacterium]
MIWREHRTLLITLGVLLMANAIFFFTYRVQYEARLQALDSRLTEAEDQLQHARGKRIAAEQQLASYRKAQTDLQSLYDKTWATKQQRLTALINELKKMAAATQLDPNSISFTNTEDRDAEKNGGIGTSTVTISFTVHGTYQQIRQLINQLELSDQFVIIDGIHLASGGATPSDLSLTLRLKTLFREPQRGANQQM